MVNPATPALPPDGVSVALLTPVDRTGAIDLAAVDRLVTRAIDGGVNGLCPVGSTGEGWRLSRAQRRMVIERVSLVAQGRPVLAGVPFLALDDALVDIEEAAEAGAHGVLVAPPGYYPLADDEIIELFATLADRSALPIVLYHIPSLARIGFSPDVVAQLATHERIPGLKDSGRDLEYLRTIVRRAAGPDFRVVTGADTLLPESIAAGVVGAIAASPNVLPGLASELFAACVASDRDEAVVNELRDRLADLVSASRSAGFPAGWKALAGAAGVCDPSPVTPGRPVDSESLVRLGSVLESVSNA